MCWHSSRTRPAGRCTSASWWASWPPYYRLFSASWAPISAASSTTRSPARLQREDDLALLYITHDLATARHFADDILVLYRGRVVERGPADEVILNPRHPYTKLLAAASPDPSARGRALDIDPAEVIRAGSAPAYDHG
jgi:ABC-type antimicrobial peptide transport system ATPase subunit